MDTPFVYGRIAENKNFTDREEETRLLMQNFNNLINTIIISPAVFLCQLFLQQKWA